MSTFQVASEIWVVNLARVSVGLECVQFGSRRLIGNQMDDSRVQI